MQRHLAPIIVLLGCSLLLPALLSLSGEPRTAAARVHELGLPRSDERSCKPQAPIEATLESTAADDAGVVELAFAVTPHADAGALGWSLVLPPGAELLDGTAAGTLPAGSPGSGPLVARVRLPDGDAGARVTLQVDSELLPAAGAAPGERVRVLRALTWGRLPVGSAQGRPHGLAATATDHLALAPTRHREGRR